MKVNKMADMFDMNKIKVLIANCPANDVVILAPNWSINGPKYTQEEKDNDIPVIDWDEFQELIGYTLYVNDYNDLCIDVHDIMNE